MVQCPSSPTHPLSVQSLQSELRSLCVSSPPSIQSSPIKGKSCSPQSPPAQGNFLQIISEENLSSQHSTSDKLPSSLPNSPLPFLGLTFTPPHSFRTSPTASPSAAAPAISITDELGAPQSIRMSDPVTEFPIIPPPHAFAHLSQPNLQQRQRLKHDPRSSDGPEEEDTSSSCNLYRWKDGKVSHGLAA